MGLLFCSNNVEIDERYLRIGSTSIALDKVESVSEGAYEDPRVGTCWNFIIGCACLTALGILVLLMGSPTPVNIGMILIGGAGLAFFINRMNELGDIAYVSIATSMRHYTAFESTDHDEVGQFRNSITEAIEMAKRGLTPMVPSEQLG